MKAGRFLVTGVGGFVGKALAMRLLKEGHEVVGLARGSYPDLQSAGVQMISLDLSRYDSNRLSDLGELQGIFHVAAKVGMWGNYADFYRTNVEGTKALLAFAREKGVRRFVFTSSPSVVSGDHDLSGVDETIPYPEHFLAAYPATKALAEQEVLRANGKDGLRTAALRPHLVFGPGDSHFVPLILEKARKGRLIQVGDGANRVDLTYIDDCVEAHLCAMRALDHDSSAAGRAYFISQGEPVNLWGWIGEVLALNQIPPVRKRISKPLASRLAVVCELASRVMPWVDKPLLTRFLVAQMTTDHYFCIKAAKECLGFEPKFSMEEAMKRMFIPSSFL